jgi:hypothetical protein
MALTNATTLADYGAGIGTQGATLKVDATNKRVGVGTDSPAGPEGSLQVGTGITFFGNTGIVSAIGGKFSGDFTVGGTLTYEDVANIDAVGIITAQSHVSIADSILHTGDTDTSIRFPSAGTFTVSTNGTEAARVDSSQRLLVNKTASTTSNGHSILQVASTSNDRAIAVHNFENDANGPFISLGKSRGTSVNSYTIVQDDDELGNIDFFGADGTDFSTIGARIQAEVDGSPGTNDLPGRLIFATTADGANSPTERLRIDSSGRIGINDPSPSVTLDITGESSGNGEINVKRTSGATCQVQAQSSIAVFGSSSNHRVDFKSNSVTAVTIDTGQRLLLGHTSTQQNQSLQVTTTNGAALGLYKFANNDDGSELTFYTSRNTTKGSHTVVNTSDYLGRIFFRGSDGDEFHRGAEIAVRVDGTPGDNDMPGRIEFHTTADGASSPTERLRITSGGDIGVGGITNPSFTTGGGIHLKRDYGIGFGDGNNGRPDFQLVTTGGSTLDFRCGNGADTADIQMTTGGVLRVGGTADLGSQLLQIQGSSDGTSDVIISQSGASANQTATLTFAPANNVTGGRIQCYAEEDFSTGANRTARMIFLTRKDGTLAERMRITPDGHVSNKTSGTITSVTTQGWTLGSYSSGGGFIIVKRDSATPLYVNRATNDGDLIELRGQDVKEGAISVSGNTITYGQFLGSHWGRLEDDSKPEILAGTILETVNKLVEWKVVEFTVDGVQKRQAYNGSAEVGDSATVTYEGTSYSGTIANEQESLPRNKHVCVKVSDTAASKAVFGVFLGWDEGEEEGIIGTWNDMNIGAIGNYFIRIKSGQSLEIGDLIESDGSGCGVVQSDDSIRSKTVAKVTSTIPQTVYSDGSFLVTCVLYSG